MSDALLQKLRRMDSLGRAWRVIHDNGRSSKSRQTREEIEEFSSKAESHLTRIQRKLSRNAFNFAPATGVEIRKKNNDGIRPLVVAPIESRIVQRAIHDVLLEVPAILKLAENPHSFGGVRKQQGKGRGAVPAAIEAVVEVIGSGASYVIRSDIASFFTKIPKSAVTNIVSEATSDAPFVELFRQAIEVELSNMAALRYSAAFPIHEIGVAQGNSLSPLLGNLLLSDFDREMNCGASPCVRYIDDFLILGHDRPSAERQFAKAKRLLAQHGMEVNNKTLRRDIREGFTFLGIEIVNGAIRPSRQSRQRLLESIHDLLDESIRALREFRKTGKLSPRTSFLETLFEIRGMMSGWGHHYSFCNEKNIFVQMDEDIDRKLREYFGLYGDIARQSNSGNRRRLLGIPELNQWITKSLIWKVPDRPTRPVVTEPAINTAPPPMCSSASF
ncbi:MAG TPA: reverse transcriptase domain-containing protein [Candidatus Acidoferrales bacterium]